MVSVKLFWCEEVSSVRGGVIASSGGGRFCVKAVCDVKSHLSSKVLMRFNHLYICGKRKNQAMIEPTLDSSSLADHVNPSRLAEVERPINVWRAYFASESDRAGRSSNDGEHSWEEVEIASLNKLSEVDSEYKTLKKLKVGTLLEALADTIPIGIGKAEKIAVIADHNAQCGRR
jgi:hypothetical protein